MEIEAQDRKLTLIVSYSKVEETESDKKEKRHVWRYVSTAWLKINRKKIRKS